MRVKMNKTRGNRMNNSNTMSARVRKTALSFTNDRFRYVGAVNGSYVFRHVNGRRLRLVEDGNQVICYLDGKEVRRDVYKG